MEELKQFGRVTSTVVKTLTENEVQKLTYITNEMVGVGNDINLTFEQKVEKYQQLYDEFVYTFKQYAPHTWETIYVPREMEESDVSDETVSYMPMTYLRCVYSVLDWALFTQDDYCDFTVVEEYINYLDGLITYKLK